MVHDLLHLIFKIVFVFVLRLLLLRRNDLSTVILVLLVTETDRISIGIRRRGECSNGGPTILRIRKELLRLILAVALISVTICG